MFRQLDQILSQYSDYLDLDTNGIFDMIRRSTPNIRQSRRSTASTEEPTTTTESTTSSSEISSFGVGTDYYAYEMPPQETPELGYEETYDDLPF